MTEMPHHGNVFTVLFLMILLLCHTRGPGSWTKTNKLTNFIDVSYTCHAFSILYIPVYAFDKVTSVKLIASQTKNCATAFRDIAGNRNNACFHRGKAFRIFETKRYLESRVSEHCKKQWFGDECKTPPTGGLRSLVAAIKCHLQRLYLNPLAYTWPCQNQLKNIKNKRS